MERHSWTADRPEQIVKIPPLEYACPRTIDEVIVLLDRHGDDAKILSGGQSLMPMLAFRVASCRLLIDIRDVPGLDGIHVDNTRIEIGARVRWRDIEQDRRLRDAHPLLLEAVSNIGHYQIRNRGTVGGSLAHADPAAELPALAVTCDAQIIAAGPGGGRTIAASDFFLSPLVTALQPNELIVALRLPAWPANRRYGFMEFARRRGDFALAGAIVSYSEDSRGRISDPHVGALGVADTPIRLTRAETALAGAMPDEATFAEAARLGIEGIEPRADIHADGEYRVALLGTLLERALAASTQRMA
jgi:carbon-monoxide dehydrogenase medium subunit